MARTMASVGVAKRTEIKKKYYKQNPTPGPHMSSKGSEVSFIGMNDSHLNGDVLSIVQRDGMEYQWVLDSGASFHMTQLKEWSDTYTSTCKIVGVGGVQIQIFDGSVHAISDVRHVLD